ncbi:hypothetical protein BS78_03G053800 [Paspalum vaginatum]|nr:hypothetical protein BS78_03G053800 [Paspalum vaginatum]
MAASLNPAASKISWARTVSAHSNCIHAASEPAPARASAVSVTASTMATSCRRRRRRWSTREVAGMFDFRCSRSSETSASMIEMADAGGRGRGRTTPEAVVRSGPVPNEREAKRC